MKGKKKIVTLSIAFVLAFSMVPLTSGTAFAQEPLPNASLTEPEEIPEGEAYEFTDEYTSNQILMQGADMPASYDLRDKGYMTPVREQNPFGSCWAFAACASAESSLISSGLAGKDVDLSEKHLSFFKCTPIQDKSNSQYGEGFCVDLSPTEKLNQGGVSFLATTVFASGAGPVLESEDPTFAYKGAAGVKDYRFFDGKNRAYCYSAKDDWNIPYELRNRQSFSLKESYILPSPARMEGKEYHYDEAATVAIKEQLMNGRAVEIGFMADQSTPGQEGQATPNMSKDWAHYGSKGNFSNHAVTIVGWDDSIGAEDSPVQFNEDNKPPYPGAWLVKNSWGAGTEPFPNHGDGSWGIPVQLKDENGDPEFDEEGNPVMVGSGYFWLSYYDHSMCYPEALLFEKADPELSMQAYDYMPAVDMAVTDYDSETKMGNMFRAKRCEQLEQIAFQTTAPGSSLHYEVYLLENAFGGYTNGKKVAEGDGTYKYGGFHKVTLAEPVKILKGQCYSIIVTEKTAEGKYRVAVPFNMEGTFKGIVNNGESAVYLDGAWKDLSEGTLLKDLIRKEGEAERTGDNFTIKGYTRPLPYDFDITITGRNKLVFVTNEKETLMVNVSGLDDEAAANLKFQWRFEKEGILDLKVLNDSYSAELSVKRDAEGKCIEGKTTLYAEAMVGDTSLGTAMIGVEAFRPSMQMLYCTDEALRETRVAVYTGSPYEPNMEGLDNDGGKMEPGKAFTVEYLNNTNCGLANVRATTIGDYVPGTREWPFVIRPALASISELAAGEGKLAVTVQDQSASGLTGYQIRYREKGTEEWKTKMFKGTETKLVIDNLTPGKQYEVQACGYVEIPDYEKYGSLFQQYYLGDYSEAQTSGEILNPPAGWNLIDSVWYYYNADGSLAKGWLKDGNTWYYLDPATGAMKTGWITDGGSWYYLYGSGAMATGWVYADQAWYYLKDSGAMAASEWIGGCWLSSNGAWTYQPLGSWGQDTVGWWFGDTSGWYAKNETMRIDNVEYTFDAKGYWQQ